MRKRKANFKNRRKDRGYLYVFTSDTGAAIRTLVLNDARTKKAAWNHTSPPAAHSGLQKAVEEADGGSWPTNGKASRRLRKTAGRQDPQ